MKLKIMLLLMPLVILLIGQTYIFASANDFKDVKSNHWAYKTIIWGQHNKIIEGFQDKTFRPSQEVSESEFLAMLLRSFKANVLPAKNNENWSTPYYTLAISLNFPVSNNPTAPITRTSVAELITSTQGKNYSGTNAIKYMLIKGLAQGKVDSSVDGYKGADKLTRAEAITFIKNVMDKRISNTLLPRPILPSDLNELSNDQLDPKLEKIGEGDNPTLLNNAQKVIEAIKGSGLQVKYNIEQNAILIKNPSNDKVIFTYETDSQGKLFIQYDWINISGSSILNPEYVSIVNKALNALGIKVTDNFDALLQKAETDFKEQTFKINGITYHIIPTNAGQGTIK